MIVHLTIIRPPDSSGKTSLSIWTGTPIEIEDVVIYG